MLIDATLRPPHAVRCLSPIPTMWCSAPCSRETVANRLNDTGEEEEELVDE